ncbi:hypothetical protein ACIPZF_01330 [Pseudomonas sp. NPDC089752]|uniref:hypothetical protein n=1 Tax=Pseudomonas sp. NPDC089752 TaxID=3364472 RepID=UPI0038218ED1
MIKYINTKLEHGLDKAVKKALIVSVGDSPDFDLPVACVSKASNLKVVSKHYIEEGKHVFILLEHLNFDSSLEVAKDLGCGIIFECGAKFYNALKINAVEIERFAAQNGISQNYKRIAAVFANSVPFGMSCEKAEREIKKVLVEKGDITKAIGIFRRIVQRNKSRAATRNMIPARQNVKVRGFGYHKFSSEALEALRREMRSAHAAGGVHLWKLPMGIGKTVVINELIELAAQHAEKPVYIAPRVNISRAVCDTVARNYLNETISGFEHELEALSICVNSITRERFKVFLEQSGVVILEEVEQMIAHVAEGVCKNRVQVYNEIVKLIKNARLVIALDANANDEVIELLQHAGKEIKVLQAESDNSGIKMVFAEESSINREILKAAEAKQKSIVMVEFPSQADAVKKIYDDQGLNSLIITADTRNFPEVTEFITSPNEEILKYNGAIIYNSAMQSSTSIEIEWADHVFGLFKGVLRVSDMMQMMRRYRPATKIMISLDSHSRPITFNEEINKQYNICSRESKNFNDTAFRVHARSVEERKHIRLNLALQIELDGYKIENLEKDEADILAWSAFRKIAKGVRKEKIARTLELAHSGEIKALNMSGFNLSQRQIDEKIIAESANRIGLDVESLKELREDDIKFFTSKGAARILQNARCWYNDPYFHEVVCADDDKTGIDKNNTRKRKELLGGMMNALGINDKGEGYADADKAAIFIKSNLRWFDLLKLVTAKNINFETRNQKLAAVNNILQSMGLSLKRHKVKGEYFYKLDIEKYKKIAKYLGVKID